MPAQSEITTRLLDNIYRDHVGVSGILFDWHPVWGICLFCALRCLEHSNSVRHDNTIESNLSIHPSIPFVYLLVLCRILGVQYSGSYGTRQGIT